MTKDFNCFRICKKILPKISVENKRILEVDALFHYPSEAKTKKRSFAWKGFIYLVLRFCYNNEAKPKTKNRYRKFSRN